MKARNGFVSNSSSSSFVLSSKDEDPIIELKIHASELGSYQVFKTLEEFKARLNEYYGLSYRMDKGMTFEEAVKEDSHECYNIYNKAKEVFEKGLNIITFRVSNDGDEMERVLYETSVPKSEKYTILKG